MKNRLRQMYKVVKNAMAIGFVIIFATALKNYLSYDQSDTEVFFRDDSKPETLDNIVCGKPDAGTIHFADFARMSQIIYPGIVSGEESISPSWLRVERSNRQLGFTYEVWKNTEIKKLVIVFKGTSPTKFSDWHANLHWFAKWVPFWEDQYEKVKKGLPIVLEKYSEETQSGFTVYTTGHSLGGGLAQHAVYASPIIEKAYAFNSSMVTGWSDFSIDELKGGSSKTGTATGSIIYRVHENGEALEFFRLLMKASYLLNPKPNRDPYVKEYRMNLNNIKGLPVSQHGIKPLADGFGKSRKNNCPS